MIFRRYFWVYFLCLISLFSDEEETLDIDFKPNPTPWFTGPLLAPSGRVLKPGHVKLQPYFDTFVDVAEYDKHWHARGIDNFYHINLRVQTKFGVIKNVDFQLAPIFVVNETQGVHSENIGDLPIDLNIQLFRAMHGSGYPALKLALRANVPIGKYQHLSVHKKKTDVTGSGCWFPGPGLVYSSLWHLNGIHYLSGRISSEYRIGVPVRVKGRSVYGGDAKTRGVVYPGNYFNLDTSFEYNFTQNWAIACDFRYSHFNKTRSSGEKAKMLKKPSKELFSLAPAIEYNFSKTLGMIGGVWFSLAGRNTGKFINGMISIEAHF